MTPQDAFAGWRRGDFRGCEATYYRVWNTTFPLVEEYLSRIRGAERHGEVVISDAFVAAMLEMDCAISAEQCAHRIAHELGAPEDLSRERAGGWRWVSPLVGWPGETEFNRAAYLCWIKHCMERLRWLLLQEDLGN